MAQQAPRARTRLGERGHAPEPSVAMRQVWNRWTGGPERLPGARPSVGMRRPSVRRPAR